MAVATMAGMTQDLADCTAADRKTSADACTRVMNSGRLPREQIYIGHFNRGWSYFNAGNLEKALADFDKSVTANPAYADTYFSRADDPARARRARPIARRSRPLSRQEGRDGRSEQYA